MASAGGVGGGGTSVAVSSGTGSAGSASTAGGEGGQAPMLTPEQAEETLHEHEQQWATQNAQMNLNPKLFAATYGSQAGTGNDSGLNAESSGSTHTTGGSTGA